MSLKINGSNISQMKINSYDIKLAKLNGNIVFQKYVLIKFYGDSKQAITTGKNMFDYNYFYKNYVTAPSSKVGRCVLTLEPNTAYTVSCNKQVSSTLGFVYCWSGNDTSTAPSTSVNGVRPSSPRTVTTDENGNLVLAIYVTGTNQIPKTDFENEFFWIQIEKGLTATDYEPYTEGLPSPSPDYPQAITSIVSVNLKLSNGTTETSIPIDLKGNILASIDDIADELQVDTVTGDVTLTKKIRKYVVTGTENFTNSYGTNLFDVQHWFDNYPFLIGYGKSNYYIYNNIQSGINNGTSHGEFALQKSTSNYNGFFKNTNYSDADSFKTHLQELYEAGNPVEIYYPLLNTETISLDNIKEQLDSFETYTSIALEPIYG